MIKITFVKINRDAGNDDSSCIETILSCTDGTNTATFKLLNCYGGAKFIRGTRTDSQELSEFEKKCDEIIGHKPLFFHGIAKTGSVYEFEA